MQDSKEPEEEKIPMESKISKVLSDKTTRTVIILILMMLFLMPLMQEETYINYESLEKGLASMNKIYSVYGNGQEYKTARNGFIDFHKDNKYHPLIQLNMPEMPQWTQDPYLKNLREDEREYFNDGDMSAYYNNTSEAFAQAIINIGRTLFVCVLLSVGALYFSRDAEVLVLNPIERMIEKVKLIARDPLAAANGEFQNAGVLSLAENVA